MRVYFTPGPDCENNIIKEFKNAKKSVDIAVYAINNPRIYAALADAHKRGVKIRVATDRLESSKKNAKIILGKIESLGIPVRNNKGTKHRIEHNKWAIFDGKRMEYGSYNWTESATKKNSESCLFFEQQKDKEFTNRFQYLWKYYEK